MFLEHRRTPSGWAIATPSLLSIQGQFVNCNLSSLGDKEVEGQVLMPKGSRNRRQAREKIAQIRAREARRGRRRIWAAWTGAAAVVIAAAVGITLAVTSGGGPSAAGGGTPELRLAALSTLGTLKRAPAPGTDGPEGVPIPNAAPLASTATASGQDVDGIKCERSEQTIFHIHAHLTIFVNGSPRQVPAGIGIPAPRPRTPRKAPSSPAAAASTGCTPTPRTASSPSSRPFSAPTRWATSSTNGGSRSARDRWARPPVRSRRSTTASGMRGNPRDIPLNAHARIQLEVGRPLVAPQRITFPPSL